ncbi:TIR-like protein FxsC [Streptomyces europaeiscabiei]|uniref:TIR-like protein FxsC n=3 Tax=Streptomyces TaxID=1883 RepID=UPI0029A8A9E2|nr:TIR-like protein FxsC [Streptomyces europaeiscabiei]MDX3613694.1 TIR-like protein FxsC [Streptomyces europaeiscabiei]MDX3631370.1 TIR-like protein FxsC [Streptomyces europaeiscabiei]MDX3647850.1 TIR-like protein FxsC [Streptomyces europaeiscabiei]WUD32516.1 TIR-like protein FxsC [Streptomyces europaeiscabiei]
MNRHVRGRGAPDNRPYFFLSYAHTPSGPDNGDPDHWVYTLYKDLCADILAITDLPAGTPPGFMDREMRSGEGWPVRLSDNLAHCRVFVPLYSPRYFSSEACGREWFAFSDRIRQARDAGAGDIPAIVPVLWSRVGMDRLPESVRHLQVERNAFGERYLDHGIYGLIKLKRLRDEYDETVFMLAQRIVEVAEESPLPSSTPRPFESTPSAFAPPGDGPRRIHLTVAAPARHIVPESRKDGRYGENALHWNPYNDETPRPIAALAEELIRSLDYRITVSDFDNEDPTTDDLTAGGPDAHPGPEDAEPDHPAILLVDCWAVLDEDRRRRLKAFDANARPWVGAIVPWNHTDQECHGAEGRQVKAKLERTLPLILERGRRTDCRIAANGVPTLQMFTDVLPALAAHTTRQYLRHAQAHPPEGPQLPQPRLMGPTYPQQPAAGSDHGGEA